MYIAEVADAALRLRFTTKCELQVWLRLDSLSDSKMDEYSKVVFAYCLWDPDVWYGFVAIEKRDENRLDFITWLCKLEILSDVGFVYQPISEGRHTVVQIIFDICQITVGILFYCNSELNKDLNFRLYAEIKIK